MMQHWLAIISMGKHPSAHASKSSKSTSRFHSTNSLPDVKRYFISKKQCSQYIQYVRSEEEQEEVKTNEQTILLTITHEFFYEILFVNDFFLSLRGRDAM